MAKCNISPLPKAADKHATLRQFQNDVEHALGRTSAPGRSGRVHGASGIRVYRVVVRGEVDQVPIQWMYFLVSDEHGHQLSLTFTIKEQNVAAFDQAGDQLVRGLGFVEP